MVGWLVGLLVSREFYQRLNNNIDGILLVLVFILLSPLDYVLYQK